MKLPYSLGLLILAVLVLPAPLTAGVKSKAAQETAEYVLKKFGAKAGGEGVEKLTARIEALAVRNGDEAFVAVRKVGPRAVQIAEQAGAQSADAVKVMARFGNEGVWLASNPKSLSLASKYGDDAARALIKHEGIAEPVIAQYGKSGVAALNNLNAQNGRRLAMMADDGELARLTQPNRMLDVVAKYGDRGMDFIWRNKGALAVTATAAVFLANPEPFIDGAKDLAQTSLEQVGKPLVEASKEVAVEAAKSANWTWVFSLAIVVATVYLYFSRKRFFLKPQA
jgi:hypothetical protein